MAVEYRRRKPKISWNESQDTVQPPELIEKWKSVRGI
jgi:hypothetical protein